MIEKPRTSGAFLMYVAASASIGAAIRCLNAAGRKTLVRMWRVASGAVLVAVGCPQRLLGRTTGTTPASTPGARAVTPERPGSGGPGIPNTSSATTLIAAASTAKRIRFRRGPASFAASRSVAGRTLWSAARSAGNSASSSNAALRGRPDVYSGRVPRFSRNTLKNVPCDDEARLTCRD
jgi:hypothetical protein